MLLLCSHKNAFASFKNAPYFEFAQGYHLQESTRARSQTPDTHQTHSARNAKAGQHSVPRV